MANQKDMTTFTPNQLQEPVTFERLPEAMTMLIGEVRELRRALGEKKEPEIISDNWFNIDQLREYLPDKPARATIYGWVSNRQIPYHKGGKRLRFLKSEIDQWLSTGKRKSESELQTEAENYQSGKKGVRRYE